MSPEISVIIPVFNAEKYLEECLNSVIHQSLEDIEIICINDGSSDNSLNILRKYEEKDNRIQIINQKNVGAGGARYIGLSASNGRYVYFMDSDDFLELNALELLHDNAVSNNSDVVIFNFARYNPILKSKVCLHGFDLETVLGDVDFNNFTFDYHDVKRYVLNTSFAPWAKLYKKEFLDSYDDFYFLKDIHYEDVPFHVQVMLRAKLSFCPYFLYNYRVYNKNLTVTVYEKNKHLLDIFKIIDIVENFLKDNNFYDEFKTEFTLFKFIQIIQYVIRFPSKKFFLKAKSELQYLNIDFSMGVTQKLLYDTILKVDSFDEFYVNVFDAMFDRINTFNGEIIQKNNIIGEKDAEIRRFSDVISSKDAVIGEKDSEINLLSKVILRNNIRIDNQLSIIDDKKSIIKEHSQKIKLLHEELSSKNLEIVSLENKIESSNNDIRNLKNENSNLKSDIDELNTGVNRLKDKISLLNEKNNIQEDKLVALKHENALLLDKQNEILSSNSWKRTEPLRNIKRKMKH